MRKLGRLILSVTIRLILAMFIPIQIILSEGVTSTTISSLGMVWVLSDGLFQIQLSSTLKALIYCIPAASYYVYFNSREETPYRENRYRERTAFLSAIISLVIPIFGEMIISDPYGEFFYNIPITTLGYLVSLIVLFIVVPYLNANLHSEGIGLLSHELYFILFTVFLAVIVPFVSINYHGLYAVDQSLESSILVTISSLRSGWTEEAGFYYLHSSLLSELNLLLSSFYIVFILRLIFLYFSYLYFIGRTSLVKPFIVGLFQEVYLILTAYFLNSSQIPTEYYTTGITAIPLLFPVILVLLLLHKNIVRTVRVVNDEEYITIPFLTLFKIELVNLKKRFRFRK